MPIEVSEIGIAMRVSGSYGRPHGRGASEGSELDPQSDEWREDLIEECVRRVLQVLKAERER